jgi:hypothetical protein
MSMYDVSMGQYLMKSKGKFWPWSKIQETPKSSDVHGWEFKIYTKDIYTRIWVQDMKNFSVANVAPFSYQILLVPTKTKCSSWFGEPIFELGVQFWVWK